MLVQFVAIMCMEESLKTNNSETVRCIYLQLDHLIHVGGDKLLFISLGDHQLHVSPLSPCTA